jgi:hypothetical protein
MQVYRARNPRKSPLWQCVHRHFADFLDLYPEQYAPRYGFLRPIIPEVVRKFLDCGNLERGFARVRCDQCRHEYLLAFSCKGRWFCPSCHQRKVLNSAGFITDHVLAPVPHRHYVLALPKMLRPYFQRHRSLLKRLCAIAKDCLTEYLRTGADLPDGIPGVIMTIHTFGEYLDFHPHIHALVADGLFHKDGWFQVLPEGPIAPLEELFRARVILYLVEQKLLSPERAQVLRSWTHSGFNIHKGDQVAPQNRAELEQLAQYILRNPFSVEKMQMETPGDRIIYRSRYNPKIGRNFQVFTATDFLAAVTHHIPDKGAQLVRYYGFYSNKMRGQRRRAQGLPPASLLRPTTSPPPPKHLPSKKWRELILKVWHSDPLRCPVCQNQMRVIAVIDDRAVVEKILRHMELWCGPPVARQGRSPPGAPMVYEPYGDVEPMPDYENVVTD